MGIIAIDFDRTLCEMAHPDIGTPKRDVLEQVLRKQQQGVRFILWTCRAGKNLENAIKWCEGFGIKFVAVNEDDPEYLKTVNGSKPKSCKVYADMYVDDKAVTIEQFLRK